MSLFDREDLSAQAGVVRKAKEEYVRLWYKFSSGIALHPDRFWEILEEFKTIVISRLNSKYTSRESCDELFRQAAVGELEVSFDELVGFSNNWSKIDNLLRTSLTTIIETKSDDGFGDLCDSLPLVGREIVSRLFTPAGMYEKDVFYLVGRSGLRSYIWDGENYFGMNLDQAAQKRYIYESASHEPLGTRLV